MTDYTQEQVAAMNAALEREQQHSKVLQAIKSCLEDFEPPDLAIACEILNQALAAKVELDLVQAQQDARDAARYRFWKPWIERRVGGDLSKYESGI